MKTLNPTITIIMPSHMKPEYLPDALDGLLTQTRTDFELVVVDSGEWIGKADARSKAMEAIHDAYSGHPLLTWFSLGEPPGLILRKCPISYIINEVIRKGLVRGKYVCVATDDDIHKPTYLEEMAGLLDNSEWRAVYCAQDRNRINADGTETHEGVLPADAPRHGASFLNNIDMLQMMFQRSLLEELADPWFDENPIDEVCRCSDGLFMNKIGELVTEVGNVPRALVVHRFTPLSTYN